MSAPKRGEFAHFIPMSVRWGDMDSLGHVNNVQYFRYAESGRIAYFEALEKADPTFWKEHGIIMASIGCDFLAQVHYPAELEVATRVSRLGRSSLETVQGVFQGEQAVAALRATIVWFDYRGNKSLPIPEHARTWIRAREVLAPQE
jgi:acyl-CoA thioester hydrolase